jgi:sugar phosphate isomerase/epimerase
MSQIPVALQMYTVRDVAADDFVGALRQVAEIGYAGVELAGMGNLSSSELKETLDNLGLQAAGTHVSLDALRDNLEGVIQDSQNLGSRHVTLSYVAEDQRKTLDGWRQVADLLNRTGQEIKRAGLQLCYHNHAFEFETFDGKFALDWLYELTDPDLVQAELDTYWIQFGGQDPAVYVRKYAGRVPLVHLKDMEAGEERFFAEVGEGIMDWAPVFSAGEAAHVQWYIVEQDRCRRPSMESARLSYENLKKMGKA